MNRIANIATALAFAGFIGLWAVTALVAGPRDDTAAALSAGIPTARMPIATILILQDAEAVKREHARMGLR